MITLKKGISICSCGHVRVAYSNAEFGNKSRCMFCHNDLAVFIPPHKKTKKKFGKLIWSKETISKFFNVPITSIVQAKETKYKYSPKTKLPEFHFKKLNN